MFKVKTIVCVVTMLTASVSVLANETMSNMHMNHMDKTAITKQSVQAVGIITAIDTNTSKLTLNHQAIKALNWPPMTMGFKVVNKTLLNNLKVGQKVSFELKPEGSSQVIVALKPIK